MGDASPSVVVAACLQPFHMAAAALCLPPGSHCGYEAGRLLLAPSASVGGGGVARGRAAPGRAPGRRRHSQPGGVTRGGSPYVSRATVYRDEPAAAMAAHGQAARGLPLSGATKGGARPSVLHLLAKCCTCATLAALCHPRIPAFPWSSLRAWPRCSRSLRRKRGSRHRAWCAICSPSRRVRSSACCSSSWLQRRRRARLAAVWLPAWRGSFGISKRPRDWWTTAPPTCSATWWLWPRQSVPGGEPPSRARPQAHGLGGCRRGGQPPSL